MTENIFLDYIGYWGVIAAMFILLLHIPYFTD